TAEIRPCQPGPPSGYDLDGKVGDGAPVHRGECAHQEARPGEVTGRSGDRRPRQRVRSPPMQVDGAKHRQIRLALQDADPTLNRLSVLVQEVLGEPLQNIAMADDMPTVVSSLIVWAKSRGRLTELIIGAASENPGNASLRAVADQFKFVEDVAGEVERIVLK